MPALRGEVVANSALIGLAYLTATWSEEGRSYIDNFVPMVAEVVRKSNETVVTAPAVREGLREEWGLELPQHTVGTLIRRAHRRGFLQRDRGTFRPRHDKLNQLDIKDRRDRVERLYDATVDRLVEYASAELEVDLDRGEADAALQDYLTEHCFDVALAGEKGSPVPVAKGGAHSRTIVGLYLRHLQQNEPAVFRHVRDIFQGAILATALFVPDPYKVEERFGDTIVFLDSPILLLAAGYGYETRTRPQRELVELLQSLGAKVACLRATAEEARGILQTCAAIMAADAYDEAYDPARETIDYFYNNGMISSDVYRHAGRLDSKIGAVDISIEERPGYERDYQIDEAALENYLRDRIGHKKDEALRHDVDVISAMVRLRHGEPKAAVEHCDAIFATHNSDLVRVSREFFTDDEISGDVPLLIRDYDLTNLAWLKQPTSKPDLPMDRLVAACHATVQPGDDVWKRFIRETERLQEQGELSPEDYMVVRHSQEVKVALTEISVRDPGAITDGTVDQVLERAYRSIERETFESLERERERAREQRAEAEEERRRREEVESSLDRRIVQDRNRLRSVSREIARWIGRGVWMVTFAIVLGGIYLTFPDQLPTFQSAVPSYLVVFLLVVAFLFIAWSTSSGKGLSDLVSRITGWCEETVYAWLLERWELREPTEID